MEKYEFMIVNNIVLKYIKNFNMEQKSFFHYFHKHIKFDNNKNVAYLTSKYSLNFLYVNKIIQKNKTYRYEFKNYDSYLKFLLYRYNIFNKYTTLKKIIDDILNNKNKTLNKHK